MLKLDIPGGGRTSCEGANDVEIPRLEAGGHTLCIATPFAPSPWSLSLAEANDR